MNLPGTDEIHLWCVADTPVLEADLALLNAEELARFQRITAAPLKQQYCQARLAIRQVLSLYAPHIPASQWQFSRNAYGKPELQAPLFSCDLRFNLSHTQGMLVIAVSAGGELGVDVEHSARRSRSLAVAERYFSAREVSALRQLNEVQQVARFTNLWTLKEAYSKACGTGLANVLGTVSFVLEDAAIEVLFSPQRDDCEQHWRFWQLRLEGAYQVAVALCREIHPTAYTVQVMALRHGRDVAPMRADISAYTRASCGYIPAQS